VLRLLGILYERDAAALFDPFDAACTVGAAPRQHHGSGEAAVRLGQRAEE
jgi:hypothetical protein